MCVNARSDPSGRSYLQGACGSCPSSMSGTLVSIEQLLKTIEPDIEVAAL